MGLEFSVIVDDFFRAERALMFPCKAVLLAVLTQLIPSQALIDLLCGRYIAVLIQLVDIGHIL